MGIRNVNTVLSFPRKLGAHKPTWGFVTIQIELDTLIDKGSHKPTWGFVTMRLLYHQHRTQFS